MVKYGMRVGLLWCVTLSCMCQAADPGTVAIPNGGFEEGLSGWKRHEPEPLVSRLNEDKAASGERSLHILDRFENRGSSISATRVPFEGAGALEVRGKIYPVSGGGLGVYVRQYDAAGELISGESHVRGLGGAEQRWIPFACAFYTRENCAELELHFHSYNAATVEAFLDDLRFEVMALNTKPPWEGTYKINPQDEDALTAADVVGPDGIVYPNWTRCGVDGGIPAVDPLASIADFGGKPDDGEDDSRALEAACRQLGSAGGGAVSLSAGTYHLDRPVAVRQSGVVIRGAGRDDTRIVFRYALPDDGIRFYTPADGQTVGPRDRIEVHAEPKGLQKVTVAAKNTILRTWERSLHSGNSFSVDCRAGKLFEDRKTGTVTLEAQAFYQGGETRRTRIEVTLDQDAPLREVPSSRGVITFSGGARGNRRLLTRTGGRGHTRITVESTEGLARGDYIRIVGPATERWKTLTRNRCRWGSYREYAVRIVAVDGNSLTLEQPLRIEFPVIDGSYVEPMSPIQWCGVEDLTLEQTENLWISTVVFTDAWNCWTKNIRVNMTGRFPVYTVRGKWCEVRDCVFDDAWFKGGGGTAYTGWQHSWDCLMDGVETFNYRHAPLVQWATAGCVIRNGVFHNSDGQWHAGWTNENLFETCVITSRRGHGSYGFGMWASPPEDTAHGPNGPRNVVYNCDVLSERSGLWMGGMNENWLILHNRFVVEQGTGVFAKTASFDHILKGNVFVLLDDGHPAVTLRTPDCIGVEAVNNVVYGGNGKFSAGLADLQRNEGNRVLPLPEAHPPRPDPEVPSIYEWQQRHVSWERVLPVR